MEMGTISITYYVTDNVGQLVLLGDSYGTYDVDAYWDKILFI